MLALHRMTLGFNLPERSRERFHDVECKWDIDPYFKILFNFVHPPFFFFFFCKAGNSTQVGGMLYHIVEMVAISMMPVLAERGGLRIMRVC